MASPQAETEEYNRKLGDLLASFREQERKRHSTGGDSSASASSFVSRSASQANSPYLQPQPRNVHGYHQPTVSSPLPTPPIANLPPRHPSAVLTPAGEFDYQQPPADPLRTARSSSGSDPRTENLLKLLKFSGPPQPQAPPLAPKYPSVIARPTTQSSSPSQPNLLETLMSSVRPKESQHEPLQVRQASQSASTNTTATSGPTSKTQEYLLQLLHQSTPSKEDALTPAKENVLPPFESGKRKATEPDDLTSLGPGKRRSMSSADLEETPDVTDEVAEALKETSLDDDLGQTDDAETRIKPPQSLFTYVNPFDQLAESSPRNRSPKPPISFQPNPKQQSVQILKPPRNISEIGGEEKPNEDNLPPVNQSLEGQTSLQTQNDSPASGKGKETVSEALSGIGDKVDKEVEEALAQMDVEQSQATIKQDLQNLFNASTETEFKESAKMAATDIKEELEKDRNANVLEEALPSSVAEEVKEILDEAATQEIVVETWEGAEAEESSREASPPQNPITVYDFPLKPFLNINVNPDPKMESVSFPPQRAMEIALLKKSFDQVDRTLATASRAFVAFAMVKNGGMRIIRQDDGTDLKLFPNNGDRIFNVSIATSNNQSTEAVIGTGVSGTVYWAVLKDEQDRHINDPFFEKQTFMLPPLQPTAEESSGGVLKTRARKSWRHPSFFGVGRGKFIHIIWPSVIMRKGFLNNDRTVDTAKYFASTLKINTGKAGKDFTFSLDDTAIVSLDKAGRLKFWDVRGLPLAERGLHQAPGPGYENASELKDPILTFATTKAGEKAWPTSVLFVDKARPYLRAGAQRYLVVGMNQNHTLQLWDLGLGKPVQVINLPHDNESDPVCSVMFHPGTSMIIVGHPKRNKIYLIHLSAPKWNLPKHMTQAEFMTKIANGDPSLTQLDSTACLSGIREYTFAGPAAQIPTKHDRRIPERAELLSLDILPVPASPVEASDMRNFELYAMHTGGVSCLSFGHYEIGWNTENRLIDGRQAVDEGVVSVSALEQLVQTPESSTMDTPPSSVPTRATRSTSKESASRGESSKQTGTTTSDTSSPQVAVKPVTSQLAAANGNQDSAASGADSSEKKKKKRAKDTSQAKSATPETSSSTGKASSDKNTVKPTNGNSSSSTNVAETPEAVTTHAISQGTIDGIIEKLQSNVSAEVNRTFTSSLDKMYHRIDSDKRAQAAVVESNQDAILRLISKTLAENVDQALAAIVEKNMRSTILPTVSDGVMKAVRDQLGAKLNNHLKPLLASEVQSALPEAVKAVFQDRGILENLSASLVTNLSTRVQEQFLHDIHQSVVPTVTRLCTQLIQNAQRESVEQIKAFTRQRQEDERKFEQLATLVTQLSEMISTMAAGQSKFQAEFLKMQQMARRERQMSQTQSTSAGTVVLAKEPQKSREELEFEEKVETITEAFAAGAHTTAMMTWLQLPALQQQELFDTFLSKYDPSFIDGFGPLMLFSIAVTLANQLDGTTLFERVTWLEAALQAYSVEGDEDLDVTMKTIPTLIGKLERIFMRVSQLSAQDPLLKRLANLMTLANRMLETVREASSIAVRSQASQPSAW